MKTQFLSMRNASASIGFLLLVSTTLLGCLVNKGENMLVRKLDAVLLTADDLPTMEVDTALVISERRRCPKSSRRMAKLHCR